MSLRRWVEANRELTGKPLPEGGFSYHVPAGALGYIFEDEDGDLMVAFPQSWMLLDLQNIRPVGDLPSIEDAMADVSLYEGHYSNKVDEYQYHIKLRSLKWPQIIEDYDDELTAWNWFLESLCHDELDNMMSSDCGLKKLFPDKIHQWRIAGNQGGYLIVETASAQHNSNELENEWADIQERLSDPDDEDFPVAKQAKVEFIEDTMDFMLMLKYIEQTVNYSRVCFEKWATTEDAWEPFIDMHGLRGSQVEEEDVKESA